MSEADRRRWNQRYRNPQSYSSHPVERLIRLSPHFRPPVGETRQALDLACGLGRHTLYLAELGLRVTALDVSDEALRLLEEAVAQRDPAIAARIDARRVDLDQIELPVAAYDLIVQAYFLDRRLFPQIHRALKPGGLLFIETRLEGGHLDVKPVRPEHLLAQGELSDLFADWDILYLEENPEGNYATLLARKPAGGASAG